MKDILVLGSGCAKCIKTADIINKLAQELGIAVSASKESNPEVMMTYGVMSTPAVVVDQHLVHAGSIPHRDQIVAWLEK